VDLRTYFGLLRRWWWILIILALLGGGVSYFITPASAPLYQTTATVRLSQAADAPPDPGSIALGQSLAATYGELMRTRPALTQVIANLRLNTTPEALRGRITVQSVAQTNLLRISVIDSDPQRAADIANEVIRVYVESNQSSQAANWEELKLQLQQEIDVVKVDLEAVQLQYFQVSQDVDRLNRQINVINTAESSGTATSLQLTQRDELQDQVANMQVDQNRLDLELDQTQSQYEALLSSLEEARLRQAESGEFMSVIEAALPGGRISAPSRKTLNGIQGAIAGLVLGAGILAVTEYLRVTVKSSEEIEKLTGLSTLGMISTMKGSNRLVTVNQPRSPIAEAYRVLRTNLAFSAGDIPLRSLVVSSSSPVEGKTTTAANLAATIAQSGKRVILVDTDLRRPTLHKVFQRSNTRGVTTALMEQENLQIEDHIIDTDVENLFLMPSGPLPPNPADLLGSPRMAELIKALRLNTDMVIFDSPPVMAVADAVLIARLCDAMLLVVRAESTRADVLKKAMEHLNQAGANMLGVVLNGVSRSNNGYYYHYYYSSRNEG
jgi:capsular exopolysaccharide synthesis family protein